jgi:spore coat protein U-like protein
MKPLRVGALLALLIGFSPSARAANCSITSVTGVAFGVYNPASGTPLDAVGSITYQCSSVSLGDTLYLELSKGGAGSYAPRKLFFGANQLSYNLYLDVLRNLLWGDGSLGTLRYGPAILTTAAVTIQVFGRIPTGQNVAHGEYTDTIVVTAQF